MKSLNRQKIGEAISAARMELESYVLTYNGGYFSSHTGNVKDVFDLLNTELQNSKGTINERVLRAFLDISVYSTRNYWDVELGKKIASLSTILHEEIPMLFSLQPLGMDFGKGEPI